MLLACFSQVCVLVFCLEHFFRQTSLFGDGKQGANHVFMFMIISFQPHLCSDVWLSCDFMTIMTMRWYVQLSSCERMLQHDHRDMGLSMVVSKLNWDNCDKASEIIRVWCFRRYVRYFQTTSCCAIALQFAHPVAISASKNEPMRYDTNGCSSQPQHASWCVSIRLDVI